MYLRANLQYMMCNFLWFNQLWMKWICMNLWEKWKPMCVCVYVCVVCVRVCVCSYSIYVSFSYHQSSLCLILLLHLSLANPSAWCSLLWIALYSKAGHYLNHLLHTETPDSARVVLSADLLLSACIWSPSRKRDLGIRHSWSFSSICSLCVSVYFFLWEKKNQQCSFFVLFLFKQWIEQSTLCTLDWWYLKQFVLCDA